MNEEIKKILVAFCEENGWGTTDKDLKEVLTELTPIYKELIGNSRWYDLMFHVVDINGFLIGFNWYHITGDNSAEDMGLELKDESICFVTKSQKTIDVYKRK